MPPAPSSPHPVEAAETLGWSLLRTGFPQRLLAATLFSGLLWAGIFWAVS